MKILILGYSSLCKRKIIPILRDKLSKAEFYICSKSQKPQNIGELKWYRSYVEALKNSQANLVYISLMNSQHYYWAKKFLQNNYHVIIDKPATLNLKQAKNLVKIAKRKKRLLSEAVVFNYHEQIQTSLKEIKSLKNLIHVEARFTIPKLPKENFRNFKKYGGGCLLDMGSYAAATYRLFVNENYKKIFFHKLLINNKKGLNVSFTVSTLSKTKSFMGYFSFNGKYENTLTLLTKQKKLTINRVFSPPNNQNLILQINNGHVKKEKRLKKDDVFLNYFKSIINLLKTKKFEKSYQNILKDSFFREKLARKRNL
jgi:hypothetical protein